MTDLLVQKAVVKLPKKNRASAIMYAYDYLVSDKLFVDNLPLSATQEEIMNLVKTCNPLSVHLSLQTDTQHGYIQFKNKEMADRAYTLFNGLMLRSGYKLQLKNKSQYSGPDSQTEILHIKNLPSHIDNNALNDLFRQFGPMILCKNLVEQDSTFKGSALIQYYNPENSKEAQKKMNATLIQDNVISVSPLVRNSNINSIDKEIRNSIMLQPPVSPVPQPATASSSLHEAMVDYTNLYIKNLDLNIRSVDLCNSFRKFGQIVSARVMKNAQTKQSKGYGFVSFSKPDEAQDAKQEMNGVFILSKPIVVAFHEPKKTREITREPSQNNSHPIATNLPKNSLNNVNNAVNKIKPRDDPCYHNNSIVSKQQQHQQHHNLMNHSYDKYTTPYRANAMTMERRGSNRSHNNNALHIYDQRHPQGTNKNQYDSSCHTSLRRDLSGSSTLYQPTLTSSGYVPIQYYQPPLSQEKPSFRRRGSIESVTSVMTKTSSQARRQTITKAVLAVEENSDSLPDIIDMLLTLRKKDLATCLFNKIFLKAKIKQAKDSLAIFEEQQKRNKDQVKGSCVAPVVAPPPDNEEVNDILSSLKGRPINEQKQSLGDKLFPLVKSTGVKHAPRITIQLLDTIPLDELANSMYDKEKLKCHINQITLSVSSKYYS